MCEQVVRGMWCVSKWCVGKWCEEVVWVSGAAGGRGGGHRREYTTKNKNPTQRCGEKHREDDAKELPVLVGFIMAGSPRCQLF